MTVSICPVCSGRGKKKSTFYPDIPQDTTAVSEYVTCRSCGGTGVIKETVYPPPGGSND